MRLALFTIVYAFLGYWLERIVNLVYFGYWLDNSVLFGPFQLMYGVGVGLVIVWDRWLTLMAWPLILRVGALFIGATVLVGLVEHVVGALHLLMYEVRFWNYGTAFDVCPNPSFTCWLPTSLFALLAIFAVKVVHPTVESHVTLIPKKWAVLLVLLMLLNLVLTYREVLV